MSRVFNLIFAILVTILMIIPCLFLIIILRITSKGSATYYSRRIGKDNKIFNMPKFRTMTVDTPELATHLLTNPNQFITPVGRVLRKYSLDELPQLLSVINGDMNLVGPRPALHNQIDLIEERSQKGIQFLKPGITGWAQVNGRDELTIQEKVELDLEYLHKRSLRFDLYIVWLTLIRVFKRNGISH